MGLKKAGFMWRLGGGWPGIWTGGGGYICGGMSGGIIGGMVGNSGGGWIRKGLGAGGKLFGSGCGGKSEGIGGGLVSFVGGVGNFSVELDSLESGCTRKGIPAGEKKEKIVLKNYTDSHIIKRKKHLTFIGNFLKHTEVLMSGKSTI